MTGKVYKITVVIETEKFEIAKEIFSKLWSAVMVTGDHEKAKFVRYKLDVVETFHFGEDEG